MNEQQRAELERIRDVLYPATGLEDYDEEIIGRVLKDIKALLAQDALHKMAEESRTNGLRLDDWDKIGCVNHDCDKCKAVQEPWVDLTNEEIMAAPENLITCIAYVRNKLREKNAAPPPAAQPAPVQEPVFCEYCGGNDDADFGLPRDHCTDCARPQPVPVKTYHDGKPWPVQPKPWVGLTDEEVMQTMSGDWTSKFYFARAIEAKLKEKNHDH